MSAGSEKVKTEADVYALVVGRTIATLRERNGLNQGALASSAGVNQSTLSRFERGDSVPDAYTLRRIAEALDLTAAELNVMVERGMVGTRNAAASALPEAKNQPWWVAALAVAGVIGLSGLVVFAVAAALKDEKAKPREPDR